MMRKIICLAFLVLFGCSSHSDLDEWMKNEQTEATKSFKKNYKVQDYSKLAVRYHFNLDESAKINPFDELKLRLSESPYASANKSILENYDLVDMKYVGYIKSSNNIRGYIGVDNKVYMVSLGDRMGRNYGRVIALSPDDIIVRESIQDFEGIWISKDVKIELSKKN